MQVRRPIFLLALGAWLLCLFTTGTAGVLGLPLFCILLLLFPMKGWLVLLCFLPLLLPMQPAPPYIEGPFTIEEEGVLRARKMIHTEHGSWSYYGDLASGKYTGLLRTEPSSEKNGQWFRRNAARSRGQRGEAFVVGQSLLEEYSPPLRSRLLRAFYARMEGFGEQRPIAFSLLFGLREGLEPAVEEGLRELGMLHLFVLSGLHLGIYHRGILGAGKALFLPRISSELFAFAFLLFFCYLSGWHVSALRTFLLALIRSIAFYLKRKPDSLESLSAACLLLLWMNPAWAGSLSFLLGTIAYGALRLARKWKLLWMYAALIPLQLLLVERLSLLYLLANFLLTSLGGPLLGFLMLSFLLPPIQGLGEILLSGIVGSLYLVRESTFLSARLPSPLPLTLILVYMIFLTWLLIGMKKLTWEKWKKRVALLVVTALVLSTLTWPLHRRLSRGVTFFDVGQGDASLIITASGESILIDTGRDPALLRTLRTLGVGKVDHLILSHLDEDHSGLLEAIPHGTLYVPFTQSEGIPLQRGDVLEIGGIILEVLHPQRASGDRNEDSLVLLVEAYGRLILYGGDVGAAVLGGLSPGPVDVFKFPHHGARGSLHEGSLDQLSPLVSILSVGRNRYGHPSIEVIEALESRGLYYHNTRESGHFFFDSAGFRSY